MVKMIGKCPVCKEDLVFSDEFGYDLFTNPPTGGYECTCGAMLNMNLDVTFRVSSIELDDGMECRCCDKPFDGNGSFLTCSGRSGDITTWCCDSCAFREEE